MILKGKGKIVFIVFIVIMLSSILALSFYLMSEILYPKRIPHSPPSTININPGKDQIPKSTGKEKNMTPSKNNDYNDAETLPEFDLKLDSIFLINNLVDLQLLDSTIVVDLKYASSDNFMEKNVYGNIKRAYLRPEAAKKLIKAHTYLRMHPKKYRLIIYDAARPQRVQFKMWDIVKNTPFQEYVAPPIPGSLHNFGCSVDVGLLDTLENEIDMGTKYDSFDSLSQPRYEKIFLKRKLLTRKQIENRKVLRIAMQKAGFISMVKEWWHFDAFPPNFVVRRYKLIK